MADALVELMIGLMPWAIYALIGTVIAETIILGYYKWFATLEEKQKSREISKEAIKRVDKRFPFVIPVITASAYESASVVGPYAIMPVGTVSAFLFAWYFIVPGVWLCYKLFTAPPEIQELFGLMMRAAAGG